MSFDVQAEVKGRGGKNLITISDRGAVILVVKLKRTDTTLDLSQKARVVKKQECRRRPFICGRFVHGPDWRRLT